MVTNPDWKEFVALLNSNEVEYVIVGALALAWHGYPRYTGDLDIHIRPNLHNAQRVLTALSEFGFGSLDIRIEDLTIPGRVIQLGRPPGRIDILTAISGVTFDEVWSGRVSGDFGEIPASYIGAPELIRNKLATDRPKDAADAAELKRRLTHPRLN